MARQSHDSAERQGVVDRFDLACDLIEDHWPGHTLRLVSPRDGVVFVEIPLRALEEIVAAATGGNGPGA